MLKWIVGTALLIVGWTAVWMWSFVYSGSPHITSILKCPTGPPCRTYAPPADNGPLDLAVWIVGLIIIVAVQQGLYRRRLR
jgi:hypothetical protein